MPAPKVRGDYDQLQRIAQGFGAEASNSQSMLHALTNNINALRAGEWVGQGATAFYAEMDSALLPSLKRMHAALEHAQQATLKLRMLIQQAERDAAALLKDDGAAPVPAPGQPGAPVTGNPGSGAPGAGNSLTDKLVNWAKEKLDNILVKFLTKQGAKQLFEKYGLYGLKELLERAGKEGTEALIKLGLRNVGKLVPLPVVDVAIDLVANVAVNLWEYKDKGLFTNPEFYGSVMKDTTISIGTAIVKWGGIVATGIETAGAGAVAFDLGAMVIGAGADMLFGKALTNFYSQTPGAQLAAGAAELIGSLFGLSDGVPYAKPA